MFWVKNVLKFYVNSLLRSESRIRILDPKWKNTDPGSEISIPDPQLWLFKFYSLRVHGTVPTYPVPYSF
jgi:hypothetical protein